jgi:predicted DNA-binding transcriptional regulator YafY
MVSMDKFDRIFQLHSILRARKTPISFEDLRARLECSKSTLHRALNALRDRLNAPVVFDKDADGYRYAEQKGAAAFELPGLWFTPAELQALALIQRLLKDLGGGLLEEHLGPLSKRLDELTRHRRLNLGQAASRLRFTALAARPPGAAFQLAASATLQRRQLRIRYHGRGSDEHTERTISPQRVTHYRESWYLDAWDETKRAHRSFSVDRIEKIEQLTQRARDIPEDELDAHYASAYGIFSGQADKEAVLHFTAERARWVADEQWHPRQVGTRLADGTYELRIPYHDPRELVMDILRHGPHVKVIEPAALREEVRGQLARALSQY